MKPRKQYYDVGTYVCPICLKPYLTKRGIENHIEKQERAKD